VIAELRQGQAKSTGKLHNVLYPDDELSRDVFEEVLGGMARAGLVLLSDAVFEKEGKQIPYRKASLTRIGYAVNETTSIQFVMKDAAAAIKRKRKKKTPAAAKRKRAARPEAPSHLKPPSTAKQPEAGLDTRIEEKLRAWRLAEAKRRGVPAFRIFSDQTLRALATKRPATHHFSHPSACSSLGAEISSGGLASTEGFNSLANLWNGEWHGRH
jgi:superfamily II DNA helicase RecQ